MVQYRGNFREEYHCTFTVADDKMWQSLRTIEQPLRPHAKVNSKRTSFAEHYGSTKEDLDLLECTEKPSVRVTVLTQLIVVVKPLVSHII